MWTPARSKMTPATEKAPWRLLAEGPVALRRLHEVHLGRAR